ncbi:MAG: tripartite tricarboxylate transporter substrate binding protein [Betaproteobacteria bacterium]|nr:tripartite tricarboxylate transporter substrate binding protein [Betaproteobacteria bacterium]NBY70642.1 tripartite tricarboxylate transporter substrate binding protein [Betaproteobacteria bacterium]
MKCFNIAKVALVSLIMMLGMAVAQAQNDYPSRPIKLIVGYAAGGPTDVIARIVAQELTPILGQSVVVENRAGANGNIGNEAVANATADGYTILVNTLSLNVNPLLNPGRVKYDSAKDFAPINLSVILPQYLVVAHDAPFKTVSDLVNKAKASPGAVTYGSAGNGGSAHLSAALLAQRSNTKMTHVPFKGNGPALTEVMAGRVDYMFYPMIGVADLVAQNRLRILSVTTSKRHPDTPNVPTMAEAGYPGFEEYVGPVGFVAPAGTPANILEKLSNAIGVVMAKPTVLQKLTGLGGVVANLGPNEYRRWLVQDQTRWAQLIKQAEIKDE